MRILFLSTRQAKPSFRFRIEQMLPFFAARGHACSVEFLPGDALRRLFLYRRLPHYDAVVIQKRLLSRGEVFLIRRRARRLIYDLDDAVMYNASGDRDHRRQSRFRAICRAADLVTCGNRFLADQARSHALRVEIVPTAIDAERFHPRVREAVHRETTLVTVGWTGSSSTNRYLNELLPVLSAFEQRIRLKVITDSTVGLDFTRLGGVPVELIEWSAENEVTEAATFDIGVMPLPNNPWTRGKCGFKALQYMSLGLPAVCSPVGVNREIIEHGVTGFLPRDDREWQSILDQLVRDARLRSLIGRSARNRILAAYSTDVVGPAFATLVEDTALPLRQSA